MANSVGKRPTDHGNESVPKQLLMLDSDLSVKPTLYTPGLSMLTS